jgi:NAD(P)-dependent dehydrogenase (short-subunit alcohol dehydrogenase family)
MEWSTQFYKILHATLPSMSSYPVDTPVGRLKGKTIVITGASSGIALATAHVLACSSANLSLSDVQPIRPVVDELLKHYPEAKVIGQQVDVRDNDQVTTWIKGAVSHFWRLDGAANIAGVLGKKGELH